MYNIGQPLGFPRRMRPAGMGGVKPVAPMPPMGPPVGVTGGIRPLGSPDEGFTGGIRPLPSPNEGFPALGNPVRPIVDPSLVKPQEMMPGPPPPMMGDLSMPPVDPKGQMRDQNRKKFGGLQPMSFLG